MTFNKPPEWGKRFDFPENIQVEYNGTGGMIASEIAVKMAERYDNAVVEQIAMEAKMAGVASVTVLNKAAILEALEKQVPKEPLPEPRYYGNGKCPRCGAVFLDKSTNYCGNCGQALDWRTDNV